MLKPAASPPVSSEKKPVKKLFDRSPVAEETAAKTTDNSEKTDKSIPKKSVRPSKSEKANDLADVIEENKSLSVYGLAMLVLIILMLWTGVLIVEQVQDYHAQYRVLQKLKREHRNLEIEHQRLLIEQQTFSATPQIAKRAVAELNMYYPQLSDRMILQANSSQNSQPQADTTPVAAASHTTKPSINNTAKNSAKPTAAANTSAIQNPPVTNPINQEAAR